MGKYHCRLCESTEVGGVAKPESCRIAELEAELLARRQHGTRDEGLAEVLEYLKTSKRNIASEPHYSDPVKQAGFLSMRITVDSIIQFVEQRRDAAGRGM